MRLITNKLFSKKLFPYLKFTHVLLIYIYSTLFTVTFVVYITFKRCYLTHINNSVSNYFCRLKYTSWLFLCVYFNQCYNQHHPSVDIPEQTFLKIDEYFHWKLLCLFEIPFLIISRNFTNFQVTQNTDHTRIILYVLAYQLLLNDLLQLLIIIMCQNT